LQRVGAAGEERRMQNRGAAVLLGLVIVLELVIAVVWLVVVTQSWMTDGPRAGLVTFGIGLIVAVIIGGGVALLASVVASRLAKGGSGDTEP
jgi:hypothetical protein